MQYSCCLSVVLLFSIVLNLCLHNVAAKPSMHYGRCTSSRVAEGFCRSLTDCTILKEYQNRPNNIPADLKCDASFKDLICCPKDAASLKKDTSGSTIGLPQPPYCGQPILDNKIFQGDETAIDEFPWMAIILYSDKDAGSLCGGTLISDLFVLTAAHCVNMKTVSGVRLGEWDTDSDPDCQKSRLGKDDCSPGHVEIDVIDVVIHPAYRASGIFPNDIALLRMSKRVIINDWIRPICLTPASDVNTAVDAFAGTTMNIAGWGNYDSSLRKSQRMLKAEIPVWLKETCQEYLESNRMEFDEGKICAGNTSFSCHGDSGGPLMHTKSNKKIYQIGIISMGGACQISNRLALFTKIDTYIDWITHKVYVETLLFDVFEN